MLLFIGCFFVLVIPSLSRYCTTLTSRWLFIGAEYCIGLCRWVGKLLFSSESTTGSIVKELDGNSFARYRGVQSCLH